MAETPPTPHAPRTPAAQVPPRIFTHRAACTPPARICPRAETPPTPPPTSATPRALDSHNAFAHLARSQRRFCVPPPPPEEAHPPERACIRTCWIGGGCGKGCCLWCDSQQLNLTDELLKQRKEHIRLRRMGAPVKGRITTVPMFGSLARYVTVRDRYGELWWYDRVLRVLTRMALSSS